MTVRFGGEARLRISITRPPASWDWELLDGGGCHSGTAELHVASRGHQILLERGELAKRMPAHALRAEMASELRHLLGDEAADALERSRARFLIVEGRRSARIPLSLPFELLFNPRRRRGAVIRKLYEDQGEQTDQAHEQVVAAYALRAEDPYLPLHLEAHRVADRAREARVSLAECFLTFTGEDLLDALQAASIAHLAGHGTAGSFRCEWRDDAAGTVLTSGDLISVWRANPPRVVVLAFCESSSERDELRLTQAVAGTGSIDLRDFVTELSSPTSSPSSSMAFDLAAALPTAVIAMRTTVDDTQARRFVDAFYESLLVCNSPVDAAYADALGQAYFHDGVGMPVPILYMAADSSRRVASAAERDSRPHHVRCLSPEDRRLINTTYEASAPLGRVLDRGWVCRITGHDASRRQAFISALREAVVHWRALTGRKPSEAPAEARVEEAWWEVYTTRPPDQPAMAVQVEVDSWSSEITIAELLASRGAATFADTSLVARATGNVPLLVDAARVLDFSAVALQLRDIAGDRRDRNVSWDIAQGLIGALPRKLGGSIAALAERKWRLVDRLGAEAIDVVATRAVMREKEDLLGDNAPYLARLYLEGCADPETQRTAASQLFVAGIATMGTGVLTEASARRMSFDGLTVFRAWAACRESAAVALLRCFIDAQLDGLTSRDLADWASADALATLAELCLTAEYERLEEIVLVLRSLPGGNDIADDLAARGAELLGRRPNQTAVEPDWEIFDDLFQTGDFEAAKAFIEDAERRGLEPGHPLRYDVKRLQARIGDDDQEALLRDACELNAKLAVFTGPIPYPSIHNTLLLDTRLVQAQALLTLGRAKEASDALVGHLRDEVSDESDRTARAVATAAAIHSLVLGKEPRAAREIYELLRFSAGEADYGTFVSLLVHRAEAEVLLCEGRVVNAAACAQQLLDEFGAWTLPRADFCKEALATCAAALAGTAQGLALTALLVCASRRHQLATENGPVLAHLFADVVPTDARTEGAALPIRLQGVFAALGVSSEAYFARLEHFVSTVAEFRNRHWGEASLGDITYARLKARADDGCPLARRILAAADRQGATEVTLDAFDPQFAMRHGRLRDLLAQVYDEVAEDALPVMVVAARGHRECRAIAAGLCASDDDEPNTLATTWALIEIAAGRLQSAAAALGTIVPLPYVISLSVAIEESILGISVTDDELAHRMGKLAPLALEGWRELIAKGPEFPRTLAVLVQCLDAVFGSLAAAMRTVIDGRQGGSQRLLKSEPVVELVVSMLDASAAALLGLSSVLVEYNDAEMALELLTTLEDAAGSPLDHTLRTAIELQAFASLGMRREAADLIERRLASLDDIGSTAVEYVELLRMIVPAQLVGRLDLALKIAEKSREKAVVLGDGRSVVESCALWLALLDAVNGPVASYWLLQRFSSELGPAGAVAVAMASGIDLRHPTRLALSLAWLDLVALATSAADWHSAADGTGKAGMSE